MKRNNKIALMPKAKIGGKSIFDFKKAAKELEKKYAAKIPKNQAASLRMLTIKP
jgi:hypothetical protein